MKCRGTSLEEEGRQAEGWSSERRCTWCAKNGDASGCCRSAHWRCWFQFVFRAAFIWCAGRRSCSHRCVQASTRRQPRSPRELFVVDAVVSGVGERASSSGVVGSSSPSEPLASGQPTTTITTTTAEHHLSTYHQHSSHSLPPPSRLHVHVTCDNMYMCMCMCMCACACAPGFTVTVRTA